MNKEVNGLMKQRRIARERCKEKDKEIERLNKELNYYKKEEELYRYYQQEVPRLENIINELEKWLIDEYSKYNGAIRIADILDKLKELKLLSKMYRLNDRIEKDIKELKEGKE